MLIPLTDSPQIRHANQKAERCLFTGTATFPSQVAWLQGIKLYIVTARMSVYLNILYLSRAKKYVPNQGPTYSLHGPRNAGGRRVKEALWRWEKKL